MSSPTISKAAMVQKEARKMICHRDSAKKMIPQKRWVTLILEKVIPVWTQPGSM